MIRPRAWTGVLLVLACVSVPGAALAATVVRPLGQFTHWPRGMELDAGWVFRAGDNPEWADPQLDDSSWDEVNGTRFNDAAPPGWDGTGWFRLHIAVGPEYVRRLLLVHIRRVGSAEAFVDGKRLELWDQGTWPENQLEARPGKVTFEQPGDHVIAVRYTTKEIAAPTRPIVDDTPRLGFVLWLEVTEQSTPAKAQPSVSPGAGQLHGGRDITAAILAGLLLAMGLLQVAVYWIDRRRHEQLHLGLMALAIAIVFALLIFSPSLGLRAPLPVAIAVAAALGAASASYFEFLSFRFRKKHVRKVWILPVIWVVAALAMRSRLDERYTALALSAAATAAVFVAFAKAWRASRDPAEVRFGRIGTLILLGGPICLFVGGIALPARGVLGPLGAVLAFAAISLFTARFVHHFAVTQRKLRIESNASRRRVSVDPTAIRPADLSARIAALQAAHDAHGETDESHDDLELEDEASSAFDSEDDEGEGPSFADGQEMQSDERPPDTVEPARRAKTWSARIQESRRRRRAGRSDKPAED